MSWKITPGWSPADADAAAYITAVETADNQALENGVKVAIDNFVLGCKADGIWTAIKASCILAGARTLAGALVPLVGTAPTNVGGLFVSGDYNRKTGLAASATNNSKYLNANRNNNAEPQNSKHYAAYATSIPLVTASTPCPVIAAFGATTANSLSQLTLATAGSPSVAPNRILIRHNSTTGIADNINPSVGFIGINRSASSSILLRNASASLSISLNSSAPSSEDTLVFTRAFNALGTIVAPTLAFYSIGESLDLALLDARVTTLINAFAAAIP
jgi:hypothetical protein